MAQNARGLPGANASDLARIEANASTMSPMQLRETIEELTAKQLGAERMRSAQFRQFTSQYPNTAAATADSQNYNIKTADWMANQDPVAYAIDALPAAARVQYFNSLKGPARDRFIASYRNAQKLFGVDMQNAPQ
jgi:predicted RNA-binding Zn ribbon-like protein